MGHVIFLEHVREPATAVHIHKRHFVNHNPPLSVWPLDKPSYHPTTDPDAGTRFPSVRIRWRRNVLRKLVWFRSLARYSYLE